MNRKWQMTMDRCLAEKHDTDSLGKAIQLMQDQLDGMTQTQAESNAGVRLTEKQMAYNAEYEARMGRGYFD